VLEKGGTPDKAQGEIINPGLSWRSFFSEMSGFDGIALVFTSIRPVPRMFKRASRSVWVSTQSVGRSLVKV